MKTISLKADIKSKLFWLFIGTSCMLLLAFFRSFHNIYLQAILTIVVCILMGNVLKKFSQKNWIIFVLPFLYEFLYFAVKGIFTTKNWYEIALILLTTIITYRLSPVK